MRNVEALTAFIDSRQQTPYAWGREHNDCIGFALGAVEVQLGAPVLRKFKWASQTGALKLLTKLGGVEAAFDAHFDRVPPSLAKRGDIAGVPDPELGMHPMIVEGDLLVCPGEIGNKRAKRSAMVCAWNIESLRP